MKYDAVLEGLKRDIAYRRPSWPPLTRIYLYLSLVWQTFEIQHIDAPVGDLSTVTAIFKASADDKAATDWEIFTQQETK